MPATTDDPLRAVYDCVVYLQALINPAGPAGECVRHLFNGEVAVFASDFVLFEVMDVASRPRIANKFQLTAEDVRTFLRSLVACLTIVEDVPREFSLAVDVDDEHYLNLAIAASATRVVSRDDHLLRLMAAAAPEAVEFRQRFPAIHIVIPPRFLHDVRTRTKQSGP